MREPSRWRIRFILIPSHVSELLLANVSWGAAKPPFPKLVQPSRRYSFLGGQTRSLSFSLTLTNAPAAVLVSGSGSGQPGAGHTHRTQNLTDIGSIVRVQLTKGGWCVGVFGRPKQPIPNPEYCFIFMIELYSKTRRVSRCFWIRSANPK